MSLSERREIRNQYGNAHLMNTSQFKDQVMNLFKECNLSWIIFVKLAKQNHLVESLICSCMYYHGNLYIDFQ